MRFRSLTHLLEELRARDATRKIVLLGSSSLLPFHPELGEPLGREGRLWAVEGFDNVFALEPLDLAVVKIVVGREKDLALVVEGSGSR